MKTAKLTTQVAKLLQVSEEDLTAYTNNELQELQAVIMYEEATK